MMCHKIELLEFAIVLSREPPLAAFPAKRLACLAGELIRLSRSHAKRCEAECSYEWATTPEYSEGTARLERRIANLVKEWGIGVKFEGDPRGCTVKLILPSGHANDFGGEGYYCIPQGGV